MDDTLCFRIPSEYDPFSLIYALVNAKSAKMKIIGQQYFDQKTISHDEIKSIKQTLEIYKALGGTY